MALVSTHTRVSTGEHQSTVRLFPCDCLSSSKSGQRVVKGVDVEIEVAEEQSMQLILHLKLILMHFIFSKLPSSAAEASTRWPPSVQNAAGPEK